MSIKQSPPDAKSCTGRVTYVVQHLETGFNDTDWCKLEYQHIRERVGKDSLLICNIASSDAKQLRDINTTTQSVVDYNFGVPKSQMCLLDMRATDSLVPDDAKRFSFFVFGGILGDHPPRDRGKAMRDAGFSLRRLGDRQMTTDTAVIVAQRILQQGQTLDAIPFIDDPDIPCGDKDTTTMPFRYIKLPDGQPLLAPGMRENLSKSLDMALQLDGEDLTLALNDADVEADLFPDEKAERE